MKFGIEALDTVKDLSRRLVTILRQIVDRITVLETTVANIDPSTSSDLTSEAVGSIKEWPVESSIPIGWFLLNGQAISRTTYSQLFNLIGTNYGPGDGSTTFNLENREGLVPRGIGSQSVNGRTKVGPTNVGDKQEDQIQSHNHIQEYNELSDGAAATRFGPESVSSATRRWAMRETSGTSGFAPKTGTAFNAREGSETRVSSFGTIWIIKAANTSNATTTQAEVDVLNADLQALGIKQDEQKLVQLIATQRTFKTTTGDGDIVASDAASSAINTWNLRRLNHSSQTKNSLDYFEFEPLNYGIRVKKAGRYRVEFNVQARRCNFLRAMCEYRPLTGPYIFNQHKGRTATGATTVGNEYNLKASSILDIAPGRDGGLFVLGQWYETDTSDEQYGIWYIRGSASAPLNYTDTCSLTITLIEDL